MKELPKTYDPKAVESKIYDLWMKGGYFKGTIDPAKKPFSIVMPPPNVTGPRAGRDTAGYPDALQAHAGLFRALAPGR